MLDENDSTDRNGNLISFITLLFLFLMRLNKKGNERKKEGLRSFGEDSYCLTPSELYLTRNMSVPPELVFPPSPP